MIYHHYEVAIAGGGIAGITLALMLEKLNISYILLEGRDTLESDRGAGIGIQPNGWRILDQLGLVEDIEEATIPLQKWYSYDSEGELLGTSHAMRYYRDRIGYSVSFIERPKLLPIMVRAVKQVECLKTSARVASIEETDDHVIVKTSDGHYVTADLVVGADGVRSAVRDYIDSSTGNSLRSADDYLGVGYSTVYGMSAPTEGIPIGVRFAVYRENETVIGFTGKDGIIFWFVIENLNKFVPLSQAARYTQAEAEALCQTVAHVQVTPQIKFGDIYKNRLVAVKIAVEEGIAECWHTNRAVIVGDAACKMTPAGGQGANQAIESCAVLVNKLMEARKTCAPGDRLSCAAVRAALENYAQERRKAAEIVMSRSQMIGQALLCIPGPGYALTLDMINLSDEEWLLRAFSGFSRAPVLEDLPLTSRGHLYNETGNAAQDEMKRRQSQDAQPVSSPKKGEEAAEMLAVLQESKKTEEVQKLVSPVLPPVAKGLVEVS